jgi:hypothetical protein
MRTLTLASILLLLSLAAGPAWSQGALQLADLPELEEVDSVETEETVVTEAEVDESEDLAEPEKKKPVGQVYGFVQTDMIYDGGTINPDWTDAARPTKLPAFEKEYGEDGNTYFSVRQTRFGVKSWFPVGDDQIKGIFEFDLFGVGADAGQTTMRLRHAYLEYKRFGAGQFHSPFMDIDVFPNSQDYWGPNGMAFFRNVQVRYMPVMGEHNHVSIALERPGASGDGGDYDDIIQNRGLKPRFPVPDLSAEYRHRGDWGYVEIAGIARQIGWDDFNEDEFDLSGELTGWGFNLSTNLEFGPNGGTFKGSVLYGEGVENYMNDATTDIAVVEDFDNPTAPLTAKLLPITAVVAFYDIYWNDHWTSTIGYSQVDIDLDGTAVSDRTFAKGQYALTNIQYHPFPNMMGGAELQWINRDNYADGYSYDSWRVQFSFKYSYSFWFNKDQ